MIAEHILRKELSRIEKSKYARYRCCTPSECWHCTDSFDNFTPGQLTRNAKAEAVFCILCGATGNRYIQNDLFQSEKEIIDDLSESEKTQRPPVVRQ